MSSQNKSSDDTIHHGSIPINFHVGGQLTEGDIFFYTALSTDNIFRICTSEDALAQKVIILSLQIKFNASETNKFFRLSVSSDEGGETNINEIKRQTKILRGGLDDKYTYSAGTGYEQFWSIPLHLLVTSQRRHFYLNLHFDTTPITGFGIKEFLIRGLVEQGKDYEYKNIK